MVIFQELAPLLELAVAKDRLTIRAGVVPILGMRTILASVLRGFGFSRSFCHIAIVLFHP